MWRTNLPEELKADLSEFFYSYGETDAQREILEPLQWLRFDESSNDQLLPIRQLELFKERAQVAKDDSLSSERRDALLAELDAQLDALNQRMEELQASADDAPATAMASQ
ncbi:hypothetical protein [Halomonas sp. H10-9-1]|uniref:hypothetical protein n=1 Tax=Halomonas sp. H10-9-1 TaxID=2950871 RepID=UPI0032E02D04